jgi:hypothetical protein
VHGIRVDHHSGDTRLADVPGFGLRLGLRVSTRQDRRNREMEVDEAGAQGLLKGGRAANPDTGAAGCSRRSFEQRLNAAGHEVKSGATLHRDRITRVVSQHEDRMVVRRLRGPTSPSTSRRSMQGESARTCWVP